MSSFTHSTGITVLICTYNGAAVLPATLRHLAAQQMPLNLQWEVLLVSNASTDDTLAIASAQWVKLGGPVPLHLLNELKPGKDKALALGFEKAAYPYICIVDDDNWLEPNYLRTAIEIMNEHPAIGALGGTPVAVCEVQPPTWFARYAGHYAIGRQDPMSGDITSKQGYLCGAGCVIRQDAWQRVIAAHFTTALVHHAGGRLSGEDLEQCYALTLAGYRIWFDDRLQFKHFIPAKRLNWNYLCSIYKSSAAADVDLVPYRHFLYTPEVNYNKSFIWLRDAAYNIPFIARYKWRAIKSGNFQSATRKVGDNDSLQANYYWWRLQYFIKKQFGQGNSYEQVKGFIERLRALPANSHAAADAKQPARPRLALDNSASV